jgi:hypothetical protein
LDARLPRRRATGSSSSGPTGGGPASARGSPATSRPAGLTDASAGAARGARRRARLAATARFEGAALRPLATPPPIRDAAGRLAWDAGALSVALERGWVDAPEGGARGPRRDGARGAGGRRRAPPARLEVAAEGPITAALSLLDVAPLSLVSSAGLPLTSPRGGHG